mgnify:FL=1
METEVKDGNQKIKPEMEAKGGHLKIEAKGASQRRKSEGENWRHTPNAEVGNESGRPKQTVQSNYSVK